MEKLADHQVFLEQVRIPVRLAFPSQSGWPMVISLWYIYHDDSIYCATKETARVVAHLKRNHRCGFEIASDLPPYCGIRGQARAVLEKDRGAEVLEKLLYRYLGGIDNPLAASLLKDRNREIAIRLEPVNLHVWDFSARMETIAPAMLGLQKKACP